MVPQPCYLVMTLSEDTEEKVMNNDFGPTLHKMLNYLLSSQIK